MTALIDTPKEQKLIMGHVLRVLTLKEAHTAPPRPFHFLMR